MRQILFRGKRIDNGKWVYGGSIIRFNEAQGKDCNLIFMPQQNDKCICTHDENDNIVAWDETLFYKINPSTVGQFTGLLDKNGNKIFEGDILQGDDYPYCLEGEHNYYAEVAWLDDGCYGVGLYTHKTPKSTVAGILSGYRELLDEFDSNNWLIIGNIYDNPELLEAHP